MNVDMIEPETDFIGLFIYFFLKCFCIIQSSVAKLFWWIFVKPVFLVAKRLSDKNLIPEQSLPLYK